MTFVTGGVPHSGPQQVLPARSLALAPESGSTRSGWAAAQHLWASDPLSTELVLAPGPRVSHLCASGQQHTHREGLAATQTGDQPSPSDGWHSQPATQGTQAALLGDP